MSSPFMRKPIERRDWSPAAGRLDLDHVGAQVAEHLAAERARHDLREVEHAQAGERRRHAAARQPPATLRARDGRAPSSSAASTPPRSHGHAREPQAHLDAAQRPGQHQVVEVAEVADPEHPALQLAEAGAERHVEALEDHAPHVVGVVALGHEHRGQRGRVLARVRAEHLEPPRLDRARGWPPRAGGGARTRLAGPPRAASRAPRAGRRAGSSPTCTARSPRGWPRGSAPSPSRSAAAARARAPRAPSR